MIGRSKAILKNAAGGLVGTIVYIVKGNNQSLLGLKDALSLGIVTINKDGVDVRDNLKGVETVTVNMLSVQRKLENPPQLGEGREVVADRMNEMVAKFPKLFTGVDRAQIDPIHIYMDKKVKPVQQKQRKVALHFLPR